MGFHISIKEDSERMLKKLKTSPEEIFPHRYHCYLLFLVGAPDEEAMDWLMKNLVPLDSLTGKELAFGIFMKSLKIPLEISGFDDSRRKPKIAARIPIDKFRDERFSAERIIKNNIHQHIYSGDEVMAITYATDIVAREFNVTDRLPCILLLDPIPFGNIHVVHLTNSICDHLIKLLRQSIHLYINESRNKPSAFSYTTEIIQAQENLDEWESKENRLVERIEKLNSDMARLKGKDPTATGMYEILRRLTEAKTYFEKGAIRKTKIALFGTAQAKDPNKTIIKLDSHSADTILNFLESQGLLLRTCIDTIDALKYQLADNGEGEKKARINYIYENYVSILIDTKGEMNVSGNKNDVQKWIDQLHKKRDEIIQEFYRLLPDIHQIEQEIEETFINKNRSRIDTVEKELDQAGKNLKEYKVQFISIKTKLEVELDAAIRLYQKSDPVLYSSIFVKQIKSLKLDGYLSQTKIAGGRFAENIFKPDTIMKIVELLHKMTG
jgi:uncharacterized coiled-coil DUF342 family protein